MMKRAVSRLLPIRPNSSSSTTSIASFKKKSTGFLDASLIQDLYIELSEPHRLWHPGDVLKGEIVLELKKNITDINITLTLKGAIKIKPSTPTGATRNKPEVLFDYTTVIYGEELLTEIGSVVRDYDEPLNGLSKGVHRFPFEMKLPRKNIYTSISFEKGSISYSLKASLNHNSLLNSPTSSCASSPRSFGQSSKNEANSASSNSIASSLVTSKHTLQFCEKNINIIVPINVAKLPKPKTKVASLRVSNKKLMKTMSSTSTINSNMTQFSNNSQDSSASNTDDKQHPPKLLHSHSHPNTPTLQHQQLANLSSSNQSDSSIAAIRLGVDLPQSGFLRGESIPVKIRLNHYKPIHSANGAIVTLTRVCRVDNGPGTPIQSFRKDLAQRISPLYIDPVSLSGEVSTSLKVPIDAFPTIVGSGIVTFQYYIEVLVNISSRNILNNNSSSSSKEKFMTQNLLFDLDNGTTNYNGGGKAVDSMSGNSSGSNGNEPMQIINVDKLKRAKNFLGLNTEIIVGTERVYKKRVSGRKANGNKNNSDKTNEQFYIDSDQSGGSGVDSISRASISPLNINGTDSNIQHQINTRPPSTSSLSNATGSGNYPTPPELTYVNEKEVLRRREDTLYPLEPSLTLPLPPSTLTSMDLESLPPVPSYYQVSNNNNSSTAVYQEEAEETHDDFHVVDNSQSAITEEEEEEEEEDEPSAPPMSILLGDDNDFQMMIQNGDTIINNDTEMGPNADMATLRNLHTATTILAGPAYGRSSASSVTVDVEMDTECLDKNELELRRLQALESEPPLPGSSVLRDQSSESFDFLPRYSSKPEGQKEN